MKFLGWFILLVSIVVVVAIGEEDKEYNDYEVTTDNYIEDGFQTNLEGESLPMSNLNRRKIDRVKRNWFIFGLPKRIPFMG